MAFPSRDLTNQYISLSYQDVIQRYSPTGSSNYLLDGTGNVILFYPTASEGKQILTTDQSASYAIFSELSTTASLALLSTYADTSSLASYANFAGSSSYSVSALSASYAPGSPSISASYAVTSSYAETASYLNKGANIYLSQSYIISTTGSTIPAYQPAMIFWDDTTKTYGMYSDVPNLNLQLGQEVWIRAYAGENIPVGGVVYSSGSIGNVPIVKLALADGTLSNPKSEVIGLAPQAITSGSIGVITTLGLVYNLDTSMFANGQQVYLSNANSGSIVASPLPDPAETVGVGYVVNSHNSSGIVQVHVNNLGAKSYPFVGAVTVPIISNTGSTTGSIVNVGSSLVSLSDTLSGAGYVRNYPIPAASFVITSSFLDVQYLVATYNSGSPAYNVVTNHDTIDDIQTTTIATFTIGTSGALSYVDWDNGGVLLANKLNHRVIDLYGAQRSTGLDISTSGSHINVTAGKGWLGPKNLTFTTSSTFTNNFVLVAHSASAWSGSSITGWVNNRYDDGTNLQTLGANKYVINYVWRGIGSQNRSQVLLSPQYGNYADAVAALMPSPPDEFNNISILLGRIITQQGNATALLVESAFTTIFSVAGITNHNDLGGIQGGAVGEYYHLTAAEYADGSGSSGPFLRQTGSFLFGTASFSLSSSYAPQAQDISVNSITASYISASSIVTETPFYSNQVATKQYVDNFSSFGVNYYFRSSSSDVAPYLNMLTIDTPVTSSNPDLVTTAVSASQIFASFITPAINVTAIQQGAMAIHCHAYRAGGNAANTFTSQILLRSGSDERVLATGDTVLLTTNANETFDMPVTITASVMTNLSDRLIVKFQCVNGAGTPDIHFLVENNTAAGIIVPIPATNFVSKAGDTMTGNLTVPQVIGTSSYANTASYVLASNVSGYPSQIASGSITASVDGSQIFAIVSSSVNVVYISSSGQVNINTTTPSQAARFYVSASKTQKSAIFEGTDSSGYNIWIKGDTAGFLMGRSGNSGYLQAVNGTGGSSAHFACQTLADSRMGVGVVVPNAKMQVAADSVVAGIFSVTSASVNLLTVSASGNISMGPATPVNRLDVSGNISASVITASLFFGTASFSNNATSASYALNGGGGPSVSASYASTASWANNLVITSSAQTTGSYTLVAEDLGKVITFTNATTNSIVIPSGLPTNFNCFLVSVSTGSVLVTGSGVTLNNANNCLRLSGRYAAASIIGYLPDAYILTGDTSI